MTQLLRELPALLLLIAFIKTIVCANHELPRPRREGPSYVDRSQYITYHSDIAADKMNVHRSRKLLREQSAYQYPDYQQTYPQNPARYLPFPSKYPLAYEGLYGPTFPQPYSQPYSNKYGEQYAPSLSQAHQSHYEKQLEPKRSSSSTVGDDKLRIFEVGPERVKLFNNNTSKQATAVNPPKRALSNEDDSRYSAICSSTSRSKSLCTKATNYPEPHELEALFKRSNIWKYEGFFGRDAEPLANITQHMNGHPDEEPLCSSKTFTWFPKAGEAKDSSWLFIVNTESFKQGVVGEECFEDTKWGNVTCSLVGPKLHYKSRCKQKYVYRTLVAITKDKKDVILEDFKIPCCCSCVVIQEGL